MTQKKLIAASILSADFSRLGEEVRAVDGAGADLIHVDVMDGHFVPNITVGPLVVQAVRRSTKLPIDVHLMIENPMDYVEDFVEAGADWISVHLEEDDHLDRTVSLIKDLGARAGVALNPATPIEGLFPLLEKIDFVLLMTVNPGFGGQKFISYCKSKIKKLCSHLEEQGHKTLIEIDGGVKIDNAQELARLGADIFVAGSAIFESDDYRQTLAKMRKEIT